MAGRRLLGLAARHKEGEIMSLSRDFAAFVADLTYEKLPAAVVDRALECGTYWRSASFERMWA